MKLKIAGYLTATLIAAGVIVIVARDFKKLNEIFESLAYTRDDLG